MHIEIAQATLSDVERLAPLFNLYRMFYGQAHDLPRAQSFLEDRIRNDESVLFYAYCDSPADIAGFTQLYPSFTSIGTARLWILNDLFVRTEFRKLGVARKLIEKVHEYALQTGRSKVVLSTAHTNLGAQALYESMGYKPDLQFKSYSRPIP